MTDSPECAAGGIAVTRRVVLGAGASAVAGPALLKGHHVHAQPVPTPSGIENPLLLSFTVNGSSLELDIDARASLLDVLRERLGLTGTKKGCDHGQCGACTVHIDGRTRLSCLTLAAKMNGRQLTTIEGLSDGDTLHPMQTAFVDHDALQCGYCTPGQIMSAVACVRQGYASSPESIRDFMSGNICRCGAYVGIVAAVAAANSSEG
ncbi:2Fe-2S iron-sulfur cluster binding domain-containing protein [Rhizobiales bacterium RZME27]|uniref:2Fe-2S iron-sulfur cluster binding domain-containing protein n=1 Tax=Endobacterium cereale TaxID=2663029 RepID=A0A6A8A280_9HYPH|nr:(2Fe-2S)-binding protein [Endobacterium cereale]MQY45172.1 2Fe-2S iron-sulfur cluster binding domain-containing protein [Endobacterium cereale]